MRQSHGKKKKNSPKQFSMAMGFWKRMQEPKSRRFRAGSHAAGSVTRSDQIEPQASTRRNQPRASTTLPGKDGTKSSGARSSQRDRPRMPRAKLFATSASPSTTDTNSSSEGKSLLNQTSKQVPSVVVPRQLTKNLAPQIDRAPGYPSDNDESSQSTSPKQSSTNDTTAAQSKSTWRKRHGTWVAPGAQTPRAADAKLKASSLLERTLRLIKREELFSKDKIVKIPWRTPPKVPRRQVTALSQTQQTKPPRPLGPKPRSESIPSRKIKKKGSPVTRRKGVNAIIPVLKRKLSSPRQSPALSPAKQGVDKLAQGKNRTKKANKQPPKPVKHKDTSIYGNLKTLLFGRRASEPPTVTTRPSPVGKMKKINIHIQQRGKRQYGQKTQRQASRSMPPAPPSTPLSTQADEGAVLNYYSNSISGPVKQPSAPPSSPQTTPPESHAGTQKSAANVRPSVRRLSEETKRSIGDGASTDKDVQTETHTLRRTHRHGVSRSDGNLMLSLRSASETRDDSSHAGGAFRDLLMLGISGDDKNGSNGHIRSDSDTTVDSLAYGGVCQIVPIPQGSPRRTTHQIKSSQPTTNLDISSPRDSSSVVTPSFRMSCPPAVRPPLLFIHPTEQKCVGKYTPRCFTPPGLGNARQSHRHAHKWLPDHVSSQRPKHSKNPRVFKGVRVIDGLLRREKDFAHMLQKTANAIKQHAGSVENAEIKRHVMRASERVHVLANVCSEFASYGEKRGIVSALQMHSRPMARAYISLASSGTSALRMVVNHGLSAGRPSAENGRFARLDRVLRHMSELTPPLSSYLVLCTSALRDTLRKHIHRLRWAQRQVDRLTRHPLYISPLSTRDFPHRKLILAGDLTRGGKLRRVYLFNDIICWSSDTKRETEVCREVSLAVAYATQKSPTFRRRSFLKSKHENQEKVSSASELEDLIDDADPGTRRDEPDPNLDPSDTGIASDAALPVTRPVNLTPNASESQRKNSTSGTTDNETNSVSSSEDNFRLVRSPGTPPTAGAALVAFVHSQKKPEKKKKPQRWVGPKKSKTKTPRKNKKRRKKSSKKHKFYLCYSESRPAVAFECTDDKQARLWVKSITSAAKRYTGTEHRSKPQFSAITRDGFRRLPQSSERCVLGSDKSELSHVNLASHHARWDGPMRRSRSRGSFSSLFFGSRRGSDVESVTRSHKPSRGHRRKSSKTAKELVVGAPFNVTHITHVGADLKWTGKNIEDAFRLERKLGEGAFGTVWAAFHKQAKFKLAVKILNVGTEKTNAERRRSADRQDESKIEGLEATNAGFLDTVRNSKQSESLRELMEEIDILKQLRHPRIVAYYGSLGPDSRGRLWVMMDICDAGSVMQLIEASRSQLTELQVSFILSSVLSALVYLHHKGITHRDIKGNNILLTGQGKVKLADFGVSHRLEDAARCNQILGSPLWLPPEAAVSGAAAGVVAAQLPAHSGSSPQMGRPKIDEKADIWSLGVTAIEIAEGEPPYANLSRLRVLRAITANPPPVSYLKLPFWTMQFRRWLSTCLIKDPKSRPSAEKLMRHPFLVKSLLPRRPVEWSLRPLIAKARYARQHAAAANGKEGVGAAGPRPGPFDYHKMVMNLGQESSGNLLQLQERSENDSGTDSDSADPAATAICQVGTGHADMGATGDSSSAKNAERIAEWLAD